MWTASADTTYIPISVIGGRLLPDITLFYFSLEYRNTRYKIVNIIFPTHNIGTHNLGLNQIPTHLIKSLIDTIFNPPTHPKFYGGAAVNE